LTIVLKRRTN